MFRAPLLVLLVLFAGSAAAQSPDDDEYYPYAGREERRELLTTDSTLFYRAIQTARDLYGAASDFALPRVAQRRRGLPYDEELARLGQTEVSYRYFPTLRLLGAEEHIFPGATPAETELGGAGGTREFRFPDGEPLLPYLASVRFSDRNYRVGAKAAASLRRGPWSLALAFDARTGRDLLIEGVFTHALTGGFRLSRSFASGARASLLFLLPVSMQGTRLSSSAEAFSLTDDPYYNPAWGYQSGRVRNSRVRREILPLAVADLAVPLSAHTELRAGLSSEAGVLRYSMLDWFDARTPMPDNYRYLPSYTGDRETRDAWLADELMQMIATEHNLSETAFVVREGEAWRIRWFTPSVEVALCGHATLAAAHVLFEVYDEPGERLEFISRSGALRVNREDERLVLDFPAQYPSEVGSTVELEQALGLPPVDVLGSTDKLLVLLESEEAVRACRPDFAALARLPWRGVIVTARGLQKDFVSRFFAPAMGVDEDPVTGSAHCSLIPYWAQRLNKLSLTAQQCSARGGELWCRLEGERVSIAGHAVLVASGRIRLG